MNTSAPEEEKDNNENFNPRRKHNLPAYLLPNIIPSQKKIQYYLANSFRGSQLAILHLRIATHSRVVARRFTKKKKSVAFSLRCTKCAFGFSRLSHIHCPCALTSEAINPETLDTIRVRFLW
jgi:lipopolysaccharide biosynthesis regulator YciM